MAYTDCFGQKWPALDGFKSPRVLHTFPILDGKGRCLGSLFFVEGLKVGRVWTHSLQSHGREPFATEEQAKADFFETKQNLPTAVHKQIFGTP